MGEASCASVGSIAALSSILNLKLVGSLSGAEIGPTDDYKALVCVFLAGGNDSFNMLLPQSGDGYAEYAESRRSLALPVSQITPLSHALPDGRQLGLNVSMPGVLDLYEAEKAAFVANVGTLVEATTVSGIQNGTATLPLGLFSHSDQQLHWQTSLPDTRSPDSGWAGRLGDFFKDLNGVSGVSMNISTAGTNVFQSSSGTSVFSKAPAIPPVWRIGKTRARSSATAGKRLKRYWKLITRTSSNVPLRAEASMLLRQVRNIWTRWRLFRK